MFLSQKSRPVGSYVPVGMVIRFDANEQKTNREVRGHNFAELKF